MRDLQIIKKGSLTRDQHVIENGSSRRNLQIVKSWKRCHGQGVYCDTIKRNNNLPTSFSSFDNVFANILYTYVSYQLAGLL